MLNQAHTRFHPLDSYNRKLAPEVTDVEPGMAMLSRLVDGAHRVFPSTGVANEGTFAGVSWTEKYAPTTHIRVRSFPITADGYELPDAVVGGNDGYSVRIAGTAATEDNAAPTAAGHVFLDGKVLRFFTGSGGDLGKTAIVTYRHNLSVTEAMQLYGNGPYGQSAAAFTGVTGIVYRGLIFTNMFDMSADWAAPVITDVKTGPGGTFVRGGSGAPVPAVVIHAPSEDNPFLGLRINQ